MEDIIDRMRDDISVNVQRGDAFAWATSAGSHAPS